MTIAVAAVSAAQRRKEETRRRILDTAIRLFQERGADGVGVDEIMREAGLTHGGFYTHFENKEALVAEACIRALDLKIGEIKDFMGALDDDKAFDAYTREFLGGDLRTDSPVCPMAILGPEVARREPIQKEYASRIRQLISQTAKESACTRDEAILMLSALVGATVLAAQTSCDVALAKRIISATRNGLLQCKSES